MSNNNYNSNAYISRLPAELKEPVKLIVLPKQKDPNESENLTETTKSQKSEKP